jgi:acyl carrier protein
VKAPASVLERCCSIVTELLPDTHAGSPVEPSSSLRLLGFDSMRFLSLIALVEQRFDVLVEPDDMDAQNFATPASIERFVSERLSRPR